MSREDWSGAIVRLRDGRLSHVQLGATRYLGVHTEDDTLLEVDRHEVVMVRPPLGFQPRNLPPLRERAAERLERTGPWWAGIIGLMAILSIVGMTAWYLTGGTP